jgi:hypothetical protein
MLSAKSAWHIIHSCGGDRDYNDEEPGRPGLGVTRQAPQL